MPCPYIPSGKANAAARVLAPVKTPISKTFFAPKLLMRRPFKDIISGAPIILDLNEKKLVALFEDKCLLWDV